MEFNLNTKLNKTQATGLNPIVLAFVGDAVYSLFVRQKLVFFSDAKSGELNKLAVKEVKASAQANLITKIMPLLTEEEISIFKRARNSKKSTKAKSATVTEYNLSTGFEAVIGYLYLIGEIDRINFLINEGNKNEN
jgi:ribonuclease-3 family protein